MTGNVEILLFVEDPAQECFLVALVKKVAADVGMDTDRLELAVRNASGGRGRALTSYTSFIRDFAHGASTTGQVVVAIDSNCRGRHQVAREIAERAERASYPGQVVAAVPVPHIERWYLLDEEAFRRATGGAVVPCLPDRCESGYYKHAVIDALREFGVIAPLGAAPYADEYVDALDIDLARRRDNSFDSFYEDLRQCLIHYVGC